MKQVRFGIDQFNKETPAMAKRIYRAMLTFTAFWGLAVEPRLVTVLSEHTRYIIDSGLSISAAGLYYLLNFFGVTDIPKPSDIHEPAPPAPPVAPPAPMPAPPADPAVAPTHTDAP
jgi:hypothetical protein